MSSPLIKQFEGELYGYVYKIVLKGETTTPYYCGYVKVNKKKLVDEYSWSINSTEITYTQDDIIGFDNAGKDISIYNFERTIVQITGIIDELIKLGDQTNRLKSLFS